MLCEVIRTWGVILMRLYTRGWCGKLARLEEGLEINDILLTIFCSYNIKVNKPGV